MRPAPFLCLAALAGCAYPDPDLRPAPPRRAAFGEATPCHFAGALTSQVACGGPSKAWADNSGVMVSWQPFREPDEIFINAAELRSFAGAVDPALSPDGKIIAFARRPAADAGAREILANYREEGSLHVVARTAADCRHPAFAPEGKSLAWETVSPDGAAIWRTELETARATFVTFGSMPAWSPDGQWIAFESGSPPSIYKVRPDGSERTRLTEARDARRPTWSPDSLWIAFGQFDAEGQADDIWAIRADASRYLRVTWDPAPEWDPCWAPDGRIFFTTIRNGAQGIWAVAPENRELLK